MKLTEYFSSQCRATGVILKTQSPTLKNLTSGKNNKNIDGLIATYSFDGFKLSVSFIERAKASYAQQIIWLGFTLDSDPTLPFSVYDILAYIQPDNFNCYTYAYVDSKELMRNCFGEINELLTKIVPELTELLKSGVHKNKLITDQRACLNRYFGENVLESGEMIGGAADTLINLMIKNFYDVQIETAVIGSQAHFYNGKLQKALLKLKKSKYRSLYHENLIKYIENGGNATPLSDTAKSASIKEGSKRHDTGIKGAFKFLGLTLLFDIPVTILSVSIFLLICTIYFKDNLYIAGLWENIVLLPSLNVMLSGAFALHFIKHQRAKPKKETDTTVCAPQAGKISDTFLKYFTIFGETLALLGCFSCVFATTVFYENSFKYSVEDFPLKQNECQYSSVEYFALVDGFKVDKNFKKEPYIVVVTKNGEKIDLYNSTFLTADIFQEETEFLKDKGIEIKDFKTIEDIK